jgi:hypothetical protein
MTALTTSKQRKFLADHPTVDMLLPLKATTVVYEGALLEWTSGAIDNLSGAGVFAGFAMETKTGGASDGTEQIKVRCMGAVEIKVNGAQTPTLGIVGVAATVPEGEDNDTVSIETGAAVTGTLIGKFAKVLQPSVVGGKVVVSFKAGHLA